MTITLEIFSSDGGQRWVTFVGDERLGELKDPLTDGARILLARGHDPATKIALKHKGNTYVSLTAQLGWAAENMVEDDSHGTPRFRTFRPWTGIHPKRDNNEPPYEPASEREP